MLPQADGPVSAIAHGIQLAVAPVFLLTGVSALLGVLTGRLSRIVDRSRKLESELGTVDQANRPQLQADLRTLWLRARLIHWAIILATTSALMVCVVVATLFVGVLGSENFAKFIAVFFVGAMAALSGALLAFLREIREAIRMNRAPS